MALFYLSENQSELAKKPKKKLFKGKLKEKLKGKGKLKKFALAPARASFLALVRFNILRLAEKIKMAYDKSPNDVINFWKKLGGDWTKLKDAVNKGLKRKGKRISEVQQELQDELGFSVAAAISSATPVLVAINKLFKSLNIKLFNKKKQKDENDEESPDEGQEENADTESEEETESEDETTPDTYDESREEEDERI